MKYWVKVFVLFLWRRRERFAEVFTTKKSVTGSRKISPWPRFKVENFAGPWIRGRVGL